MAGMWKRGSRAHSVVVVAKCPANDRGCLMWHEYVLHIGGGSPP